MAYLYPWGNTQELNLDWIIQKIKELENGGGSGADIEEIANVLVALTYRSANTYQRYDYAFYNGKLYRATANTTGVFNPSDWLEVQIGNDVAILTRLVNAIDASMTTLQGQVSTLDAALTTHFPNDWIADLNDLPHNTVVMGKFNNLSLNIPIASTGSVWHFSTSANSAVQIIEYVTTNGIWYRCKESGTWRAWQRIDNEVLTVATAFAIPASGSYTTKNIEGITADYILIAWNFSASPENSPPVDLSWSTASGSFTITNNGGTSSETIKPVFIRPVSK